MVKRIGAQEFAVIGLGRFGYNLALKLEALGHSVMAIDQDEALVQSIADRVTQAAALDATNEEALRVVDPTTFDAVVVAMGVDFEANLLITAMLKDLGVKRIICKAQTDRQSDILLRIGADKVILPEKNSAERLAEELSTPAMLERLKLGPNHSLAEVVLPSRFANQSLAQGNLRQQYHVMVLLIEREGDLILAPPADAILQAGDVLVVLGSDEHVAKFSKLA